MTVHPGPNAPVVVGVDGSRSALDAVRWAAEEAGRRHRPLRLVHAEPPLPVDAVDLADRLRTEVHNQAWQWLHQAADIARDSDPDVEIDLRLTVDDPATMLVGLSESAYEVVLGSRGYGGFTGLLAGSTALAVTTHARCPVVVVRGAEGRRGPVVVGVDGSLASERAVEWAFDEAALCGADLIAVHVWHPRVSGLALADADRLELVAEHHRFLAQRLAGWQEKYPDVHVDRVVAEGHVAQRLIDHAETARLLVVGSRGRGGFTGLLLGSTSQALLHHAPCPVLVVRDDDTHRTRGD
jgi:nucleotide-binding universal stress UspA family protein